MAGQRQIGFDYLRVGALLSVVWIHGSDTNDLAKSLLALTVFAVPGFVLMSAFLAQASVCRAGFGTGFLRRRIERLLPAYLLWSGVYILLRFIKHRLFIGDSFAPDWWLVSLAGGASYQLWFVPALILWLFTFAPILYWLSRPTSGVGSAVVAVAIGVWLIWAATATSSRFSFAGWEGYQLFVLATCGYAGYFPIGAGLYRLVTIGKSEPKRQGNRVKGRARIPVVEALGMAVALGAALLAHTLQQTASYVFCVSMLVFLGALWLPFRPLTCLGATAGYAYGVYLCHGVFVEVIQVLMQYFGMDRGPFLSTVAVILTAFLSSIGLCVFLGRFRVSRWAVR